MTKTSVPASYPRRILLAVTGMSPQVLTETLYALAHDAHHTPPTEVHIITTRLGAQRARTALLHEDGGQFRALLRDYPALGQPRFDEQHIHVIHSADGTPLDDIRTPDENAAAADAITALLGELTRDAGSALHVSIAGGRKTMGFYLGYAFSLFARPQDCLSHVLVSEPFENHPDFFFPPLTPRRLATRDGHHIDTADAHITLAEIPVVPLRHGLPQQLLDRAHSYIDTVTAAQSRLGAPRLHIDFEQKQITCGAHTLEKLDPRLFAWLAWWALRAAKGVAPAHWRDIDSQEFLQVYGLHIGDTLQAYDKACEQQANGFEKDYFLGNNSNLKRALEKQLGLAAEPYLLVSRGKRPQSTYGLALKPEEISFAGLPEELR